jgi:hypothetical protein
MRTQQIVRSMGLALTVATSVLAGAIANNSTSNWPQWRGPMGSGVAPAGDPPTEWRLSLNVAWRRPVPGRGHSTPIVWGDRLFLLTAIPT